MEPLPPLVAIIGGLLIGSATALFLLLSGRIAGISGLAASASRVGAGGPPWSEAAVFIVGLPIGAAASAAFLREPDILVTSSPVVLIAAGLLVGVGTRLGSGCTSGHGVCGLARLSPRSIAATATFMGAAVVTVLVARHVLGAGT